MINIDLVENKQADYNALTTNTGLTEQGKTIQEALSSYLVNDKVKGIFCVAGGWAGGNAKSKGKLTS